MNPFRTLDGVPQVIWSALALSLAYLLARRGLKKGSLSSSGALAAFLVGGVHMFCGLQHGLTLIFFYLSSSKLTRLGAKRKAAVEEEHKDGGRRNATQVLANSLVACVLAELSHLLARPHGAADLTRIRLAGAFLGHYACCCGDTWASELGILSRHPPRLITTGRTVPYGTNGGVSQLGLGCSAAGGLAVGLVFFAAGAAGCAWGPVPGGGTVCPSSDGTVFSREALLGWSPGSLPPLAAVGLACGLLGSLLDSLLGATLQYTGWDRRAARVVGKAEVPGPSAEGEGVVHVSGVPVLNNHAVNFISAAATAGMGAVLLSRWSVIPV